MINLLLESKAISINLILLTVLTTMRLLKNRSLKGPKLIEYFCLAIFFIVPLLNFDSALGVNISVTALGAYVACLAYPFILASVREGELKQKKRALQKIPLLFIVIFFTMSNHVELVYIYPFAGLIILSLKRSLAGAIFSWPLLFSGFMENSAIMVSIVTVSFAVGIYLFEDRNA